MIRPPRPAQIVAAAVLLIVISSEMLLAGLAGVVTALLHIDTTGVGCCVSVILGLDLLLAVSFLMTAVQAIRGTLIAPGRDANGIITFGVVGALFSLLTMVCCGWGLFSGRREIDLNWLANDGGVLIASLLLLWGNTAALLTAGLLLRNNADRYLAWQRALRRPPEDAEYEPE